jgi:hypothetical protein
LGASYLDAISSINAESYAESPEKERPLIMQTVSNKTGDLTLKQDKRGQLPDPPFLASNRFSRFFLSLL